jgi:hypothetical protein
MRETPERAGTADATMARRPRRVVTGTTPEGRSTIISDAPAPHAVAPPTVPAMQASVLWVTDCSPALIDGVEDAAPADLVAKMGPPEGGTLLRIADFPPDSAFDGVDMGEILLTINRGDDPRDGVPPDSSDRHFWFHKTPTLDYAIVLEGEIWALLDEAETQLLAGDVLIQRATSHAWANRGETTARVAFVLIDAVADGD